VRGALHALSVIGDDTDIRAVEAFALQGSTSLDYARKVAEDAAAAIRLRLSRNNLAESLVRASEMPDEPDEELVRPAWRKETQIYPDQLLHIPLDDNGLSPGDTIGSKPRE